MTSSNERITFFQAFVSVFTVSFMDEYRELNGVKNVDKVRDQIRSESAGFMVVDALMMAMSITSALDTPGRVHIFDANATGSDYEACQLTWQAYLYAALVMFGTIFFGTSLVAALFNNILCNCVNLFI